MIWKYVFILPVSMVYAAGDGLVVRGHIIDPISADF